MSNDLYNEAQRQKAYREGRNDERLDVIVRLHTFCDKMNKWRLGLLDNSGLGAEVDGLFKDINTGVHEEQGKARRDRAAKIESMRQWFDENGAEEESSDFNKAFFDMLQELEDKFG